jgi:hypothetical protein
MFKLLNFNYVPSQTLWVLPPPLVSGLCGCSALGLGLARQNAVPSPKSTGVGGGAGLQFSARWTGHEGGTGHHRALLHGSTGASAGWYLGHHLQERRTGGNSRFKVRKQGF